MNLRYVPRHRVGTAHPFETPCGQGSVHTCGRCDKPAKQGLLIVTATGPFLVRCLTCISEVWTETQPEGEPL